MNQPLDNFFRGKLGQAHKPAPLAAWERIDAGMNGKQRKGVWLKVAASVLIVAAGSFILWPEEETSHMAVATAPSKKNTPQQTAPAPALTAPIPAPTVATTAVPPSQPLKKTLKRTAPPHTTTVTKQLPVQQEVAYQERERQHNDDSPGYEQVPPLKPAPASVNVVLAHAEEEETEESITLVYSANEVDEKYLDKEALAKATSAQKKPSTFRKLLEKAYDLKNNQDPLGGLRQKKNEILALNFKNEKRSQNK